MKTNSICFDRPGTILLDTIQNTQDNQTRLLFTNPYEVLEAYLLEDIPPLLDKLDRAVKGGAYAAGYLAYEAGFAFEEIAPAPNDTRLAWFGLFESPDTLTDQDVLRLLSQQIQQEFTISNLRLDLDQEQYAAKIQAIKKHIQAGDVYQVNFTDRLSFEYEGSPAALYRKLRNRQPVSYAALMCTGDNHIVSLSPELFFRRQGHTIETRPMKGTMHRGKTSEEDRALKAHLATDPKNRAENLMIVDLLRNDLSRCCVPGSVVVPELFSIETYKTLFQMTSTIQGQLREDVTYADLFRVLFPCGSVTGAPKIRAMQIIHDLELQQRGPYCGAIGYISPDERAWFNVAIRTAELRRGQGTMGIGSGIVWDSDHETEYNECLLKAEFLTSSQALSDSFS